MKTFKQIITEVAQPSAEGEIDFKAKHVIKMIGHPASEEGQHSAENVVKKRGGKRIADYDAGEDVFVYESVDMAKEIKKAMMLGKVASQEGTRRSPPLDPDLGRLIDANDARRVAGKQEPFLKAWLKGWDSENKKNESLNENFKVGMTKLDDGSSVTLKRQDIDALNQMFDELNASNKSKMMGSAMKNKNGFDEILKFAKEAT
jgi:hypothetical protein